MCEMFCFQCEGTAGGTGCTGMTRGVCGKSAETALFQDLLIRLVKELARQQVEHGYSSGSCDRLAADALFATVTNVNFDPGRIEELCRKVAAATGRPLPEDRTGLLNLAGKYGVPAGRVQYGKELSDRIEFLVSAIRGAGAYYYHAVRLGGVDPEAMEFFRRAFAYLLHPGIRSDEVDRMLLECGTVNLRILELLDRMHRRAFGIPAPARVRTTPVKGRAILVSGHDLLDLRCVLEATEGRGINVYTHGEMLPAHGYPALRAFRHLAGNYGGAWQAQQREFEEFPGAILLTSNCLMPPRESYSDRLFTTGPVEFPGIAHLPPEKLAPLVDAALAAPGFPETVEPPAFVTVGFGREALAEAMPKVVGLVRSGRIRHIFLIGGCDGAGPGRGYFTRLAGRVPKDCLILTLACGKYRFNQLDFGEVDGIPRLLDLGQCNDVYSAVRAVRMLSEALHCTPNELPLSIVLSWYEQKAVAVLASLLSLGIRRIRLGPSLPAFVGPELRKYLRDSFELTPVGDVDADLAEMLGGE